MKISFVIPCRNNLVYFKWAYNSIRKNQGDHEVFICAADDASTDGTAEHFKLLTFYDPKFSYISNPGPDRVGHTILYDRIINELVKTDIAIIFHADMYLCPGALDEIEKLMYHIDEWDEPFIPAPRGFDVPLPNYKTIVSLTRIEPPLHPDGPEKYLADWGVEPDQFNEDEFLKWFDIEYKPKYDPPHTHGIFAPWAFFVKDFKEIGGHDPLYRPQSKEDSDIFNRFKLNGCKFIQTWKGCVYHITCRGSRFNPTLTTPGKNSNEWELHNIKSSKNFIRKWGSFVAHTPLMDPIIYPRYYVKFEMKNATKQLLEMLEPYCDLFHTDLSTEILSQYCIKEQPNTDFDLVQKLSPISWFIVPHITVFMDGSKLNNNDINILYSLPKIINQNGTFNVGNLSILVHKLEDMSKTLINIKDKEYTQFLKTTY